MLALYGHDLPSLPDHWHPGQCACVNTIAYIRVSKVGKKTTIKSPQIQFDEIWMDAQRNNRRVTEIVFDLNKSGQDFDREAFRYVLQQIRAGKSRHISVWKWSRWGRNLLASLIMLKEIDALGADVASATEYGDRSTIQGEMNVNQMLVWAQFQARQIGEVWQSVHKLRISNQLPHSGRKRFGYDYITADETNKHYALNEPESEILVWAYDEYIRGTGTRQIAMAFNDAGFRTEFGGLWTYQAVGKMLDTGFGAGLLRARSKERLQRAKAEGKNFANTLASFDLWLPGKQEPVIDLETWFAYRAKRENQAKVPPRSRRVVHTVSTLVFCGICSMRMSTHYSGPQNQHRWQCESRNTFHPGKAVSVSNDDVVMLVKEWLAGKAQEDWVDGEAKKALVVKASRVQDGAADEKRLQKINQGIANLTRLVELADDPTADELTDILRRIRDLKVEKLEVQNRIMAGKGHPAVEPNFTAMGSVVENWKDYSAETHNAALRESIGMIMVSPPSAPRIRSELRSRVRIVPAWEMEEWGEWFAARRQRSA